MAQGKQAKVLSEAQAKAVLRHVEDHGRYPDRDKVMVLLSLKAGLRAKEIAELTWGMITDANGELGDAIALPNSASKGKGGGRTIPLNAELRAALATLKARAAHGSWGRDLVRPDLPVIHGERRKGLPPCCGGCVVPPALRRPRVLRGEQPQRTAHLHHQSCQRSWRLVAACAMSRSLPAMPASRRHSGTSRATPTPSVRWSR